MGWNRHKQLKVENSQDSHDIRANEGMEHASDPVVEYPKTDFNDQGNIVVDISSGMQATDGMKDPSALAVEYPKTEVDEEDNIMVDTSSGMQATEGMKDPSALAVEYPKTELDEEDNISSGMQATEGMADRSEGVVEYPKTEADEEDNIMFDICSGTQATGLQFPPGLEPGAEPASLDVVGSPPLEPDVALPSFESNPDCDSGRVLKALKARVSGEAARYPLKVLLAARVPRNDTIPLSNSMPKCVAMPRGGPAPIVKGGGKGGQKHPFGKEKVSEYIAINETVLVVSGPDALRGHLRQIGARTGASLRVESGLSGKYVTVVGTLEQVTKALQSTKLLLEKNSYREPEQWPLSSEQQAPVLAEEASKASQTTDTVDVHESVDTQAGKPESGKDGEADSPPAQMCEFADVDTTQDQVHDGAPQDGIDSDVDFVDCPHESEQRSVPEVQEASIEDKTASDASQPCFPQSVQQSDDVNTDLDFSDCTEELNRSSPQMEEASIKTNETPHMQTCLLQNVQCHSERIQFHVDAEPDVDFADWEIPDHWKQGGVQGCEVEDNNGEVDAVIETSCQKPSSKNHKPMGAATKKVVILSPSDSDQDSAPQYSPVQSAHEQHDRPPPVLKKEEQFDLKKQEEISLATACARDAELAARLQDEENQASDVASRRPPPPPLPTSEVAQPREKKSRAKAAILLNDSTGTKGEKQSQKINAEMITANVPSPSRSVFPGGASIDQVFKGKNSFLHLASESDVSDDEKTRKSGGSNRKGKQTRSKDSSMVSGTKRPNGSPATANAATANAAASRKAQRQYVEALNPLPQRSRAPPTAFIPAERAVIRAENSATSAKWKERPVEKVLVGTRYEEEEDPELARYIWNPRTQKPLVSQGRPQPKPKVATRPAGSMPITNSQRQKDSMVKQVVDMGFDAASAQRALASTKWVSVDVALNALLL